MEYVHLTCLLSVEYIDHIDVVVPLQPEHIIVPSMYHLHVHTHHLNVSPDPVICIVTIH